MTKTFKYLISAIACIFVGAALFNLQASFSFYKSPELQDDEVYVDTLANTKAEGPQFKLKKDPAYPSGDLKPAEGIQLKQPSNLRSDLEYDPVTKQYVFTNKIGNVDYRPASTMSMKEFQKYENKRMVRNYWETQANGGKSTDSRGFRPSFNLGSQAMDMIFGSSTINIVPQGQAELIFGVNVSSTANPSIPVKLRKTPSFNFEEKIQMNVTGTIGDRLKLGINYNTDATFDFENKTKLEYAGDEDDIIKKIEAGDVTLPLPGTLITGSQSLFGIKTELQFGKLNVTTVLSQQKGQTQEIKVQGGAQVSEFDVAADEYEDNKHFFLGHAFKEKYDEAHATLPRLSSAITITRIEVWVTNRKGKYDEARDVVAFVDLGENNASNLVDSSLTVSRYPFPNNKANSLYEWVLAKVHSNTIDTLDKNNLILGKHYEKIANAYKLSSNEYSVNEVLGYISLNSALKSDEKLAVAYEFRVGGSSDAYKVGEFASDNPSGTPLVLKLIKGTNLSPSQKTWGLMMKNIYSLNAYDVSSDEFYLNVMYRDDKKGTDVNYIPETEGNLSKVILLKLLELDNVNSQLQNEPDGVFDFIDGVTIDKRYGRIIFPTLEPFGSGLAKKMKAKGVTQETIDKYIYPELYSSTQTKARLLAEKNKFKLKGTYKSSTSSEIYLNAMNVPQGSVKVTCGGMPLQENQDYVVDYAMGTVKIVNSGIMSSGQPIKVSLENNSMFAVQTKTMIGTHLDYKFNDDFNIGATVMHLNERPLTKKVSIGDEPISNTIWGLNSTYKTNSQFLTTLVDKIPLIQTKETSSITVMGEFAQLIPGSSKAIGKNGVAYIDDFEGSETTIDLKSPIGWTLSSTPSFFKESNLSDSLDYGKNRAKLSWYVIDPLFTRDNNSLTPTGIKDYMKNSVYAREIYQKELFPKADELNNLPTNLQVLNLTYYPYLKGPYNFDDQIDKKGHLLHPEERWGGMMREIQTNDFEAANVEYLEFWMMDPFLEDKNNPGGELYINLGDVSEDILKDGHKSFEQGLSTDKEPALYNTTVWGHIPQQPSLVKTFSPETGARKKQDVGLDGLNDEEETSFFKNYTDRLTQLHNSNSISDSAYNKLIADPASDNFRYFKDDLYDDEESDIIDRYMSFNGVDGNSPEAGNSIEVKTSYSTPDVEDINDDNNMDENEKFFEYRVDIRPGTLQKGRNFIVDTREANVRVGNENKKIVYYQFKIPITDYIQHYGDIEDFTSIRFMRMFLTGFEAKTTLRFATLELVRGEWRKYTGSLKQGSEGITDQPVDGILDIQSVNIEENENYQLPPGIDRVIDPNQSQIRQLNEQSMVLKVIDLADADARAAFKTANLDMRQYKKLKMEVHCESLPNEILDEGDVTVFIRIGSDYKNNYYEYEVPMKATKNGEKLSAKALWPESNRFDIDLSLFQRIKQARNDANVPLINVYQDFLETDPLRKNNKVTICGNPTLSSIKTIMIGVRNPGDRNNPFNNKAGVAKSAEVWVNELRLTDFSDEGGWAANARTQIKLADFGNVRIAGSTMKPGFGSIEKKVNDREKVETNQYDLSTDLELGKFFPEKAQVRIPTYAAYSQTAINPKYNPLDPDVSLQAAIDNAKSQKDKDKIIFNAQDFTERHSLNFTNVKVNKTSKRPKPYDPANFSVSYGYSDQKSRNHTVEYNNLYRKEGAFNYIYNLRPKNVAPLQKVGFLNYSALRLIKDFNFYYAPTSVTFRTNMIKTDRVMKLRNLTNPGADANDTSFLIDPTRERDFTWNRNYDVKYDITRSLKVDFSADNIAKIDQDNLLTKDPNYWNNTPEYERKKKSIKEEMLRGGTTTNYNQQLNVTYTVPINKLPMLDWTSLNTRYSANYEWTYEPGYRDSMEYFKDLGNTIRNSRNIQLNANASLTTIYNKIGFLRDLQSGQGGQRGSQGKQKEKEKPMKTVTFEKKYFNLKSGTAKNISHKLGTEDVTVKVVDAKGNEVKGKTDIVSINRVTFTPDSSISNIFVTVEGKIPAPENPLVIIFRNFGKIATGIKSVSGTYTITDGTTLPGYMNYTTIFGSQRRNGLITPGVPFVLGIQDDSIGRKMAENNWLTPDTLLNTPILFAQTKTLSLRVNIEPLDGLRIDLNTNHSRSENKNVYYSFPNSQYDETRPTRTGNFSMTILSINTFESLSKDNGYRSKNFDKFLQKRNEVVARLNQRDIAKYGAAKYNSLTEGQNGYLESSQQVLIPTFLDVYGDYGSSAPLSLFPAFQYMRPNWRVSYDGLSEIAIVKKYFKSVTLNHSYTSTYNIGSYMSSLEYSDVNFIRDQLGGFIPELDVSSVSISEQMSPLFGIDMTWEANFTSRFEYKKNRTLTLNLASNNISEMQSKEYVIGVGYRFEQMPLQFIIPGNINTNIKSDLNLRSDFSIRDDITALRMISDGTQQVTQGNLNFKISFSADYDLSDKLTVRLFYDRLLNDPHTSNSYRTTNTNYGFSVRFTLAQ